MNWKSICNPNKEGASIFDIEANESSFVEWMAMEIRRGVDKFVEASSNCQIRGAEEQVGVPRSLL